MCVIRACACVYVCEQGMQIHISQTTKDHLEHEPYIIEERGKIFVKVNPLRSLNFVDFATFLLYTAIFCAT